MRKSHQNHQQQQTFHQLEEKNSISTHNISDLKESSLQNDSINTYSFELGQITEEDERNQLIGTIRDFVVGKQDTFDILDYNNILGRGDDFRRSLAVSDILTSHRLPFLTSGPTPAPISKDLISLPPISSRITSRKNSQATTKGSNSSIGFPPQSKTSKTSKTSKSSKSIKSNTSSMSNLSPNDQMSIDASLTENGSISQYFQHPHQSHQTINKDTSSGASIMTSNPSIPSKKYETKDENEQFKIVLELLTKAKQDINASYYYFEAAELFSTIKIYDRSIFCYEKATQMSDSMLIVDTYLMPKDLKYQRKIERMSPIKLPHFLAQQEKQRQELIYQESEKQRLRARLSHFELVKLYSLIPDLRQLWKAHEHIQHAFQLCSNHAEYEELLFCFHYIITELDRLIKGKCEYSNEKQIVRSSAGPMAEAHLTILLELESLYPELPEIQDWLGVRYTEKCEFDEATIHYKFARDLRKSKPEMKETLELWRKPIGEESDDAKAMKEMIAFNSNKKVLASYSNANHQKSSVNDEENRDHAWFLGKTNETTTVIYRPPPQGW